MYYCINCGEKVKPTSTTFICEHCGVKQTVQSRKWRYINGIAMSFAKIKAQKTYDELFYPHNLLSRYRKEINKIKEILEVDILSNDVHSVHLFKPSTFYKESLVNIDVYICRTYLPKVSIVWRSNIRDKRFGDREYSKMWEFDDSDFVYYSIQRSLTDSLVDYLRSEMKGKGFQLNDIITENIPDFERHILMKYGYAKELRNNCNGIINGLINKGFSIVGEYEYQIIMSNSINDRLYIHIDSFNHTQFEVCCLFKHNCKSQKFLLNTKFEDIYAFIQQLK